VSGRADIADRKTFASVAGPPRRPTWARPVIGPYTAELISRPL